MKAPSGNIILHHFLILMHNLTETVLDRRSGTYQEEEHRPCFKTEDNIHPSSNAWTRLIHFGHNLDRIWFGTKVLKGRAYRRNPKHHVLLLDHVDNNEENIFPYEWEPENGSTVTARQVLQNIYWQNPIVQLYWLSHSNVLYEQFAIRRFDLFVLTIHLRVEDEVKITSWDAMVYCLCVYGSMVFGLFGL